MFFLQVIYKVEFVMKWPKTVKKYISLIKLLYATEKTNALHTICLSKN